MKKHASNRNWFALVALAILFIGMSSWVLFSVDRSLWFDESFSLGIVQKMWTGPVDWSKTDVHPPLYYDVLSAWMRVQPDGIIEHHWSRMLSILFAGIFLIFVYLSVERLYHKGKAFFVTALFAISTTILHYGTETRAYMLLVMLSSIALYSLIRFTEEHEFYYWVWMMWAIVLAIFANYYASLLLAFFFITQLMVDSRYKYKWRYLGAMFVIGTLTVGYVFFAWALPQVQQGGRMLFMKSYLSSYPSSLMFSLFQPSLDTLPWVQGICYMIFSIAAIVVAWVVVNGISKEKMNRVMLFELSFLLAGLYTFVGILITSFFPEGLSNLYHHRFFLDITWMFGLLMLLKTYDGIRVLDRKSRVLSFIGVFAVVAFFGALIVVYSQGQFKEQDIIFSKIPCENATVVHQTPWTYLPAVVKERERGCTLVTHLLSTDLDERLGHTSGFDAIEPEKIYWNQTYPDGSYYLVDVVGIPVGTDNIWNGKFISDVVGEEGIALRYVAANATSNP